MTNQGVRAAVYLRISQDATGEALGVTRQREDCLALAAGLGWEVTTERIYEDNDISATSGKARPRYQQMLKDVEAGLVDAIVVWSPDRLYRRAADLETLIPILEAKGTLVRTVKAGDIDLASAYGRMIARILGAIATGEGEVKAERWKRSWRQGREAGRFPKTGSRMFGYTRNGEIVPEEAEIARRMARDIVAGAPILGVSRWLQDEGIATTRGGIWRTAAVRQYLANPVIAGLSTLNGDIVGEGEWEPILDRDTWETVRALFAFRTRGTFPRTSVLNGLIFCGACGQRMVTSNARGKRTYRCPKRPGMDGCGGVSGNAEPIEEVVESFARTRLSDPRVPQRIAELRSSSGAPGLLAEINGLEARLVELEAQLGEPGVPVATITRAMARARDRLAEAQQELASAATATPVVVNTGGMDWPTDLAQRRALVEVALGDERVYLAPAGPGNRFDVRRVRLRR